MSDEQIELLKHFVLMCQNDANVLHTPKMAFYKKYLESLGATIPPKTEDTSEYFQQPPPQQQEQPQSATKPEPEEEPEEEIPMPDLDQSGVIEPEQDQPLPMGVAEKEVSDEDMEKANEMRDAAAAAFGEGNYEEALKHYTAAIEANPGSAMLFAKRANVLLKMGKPLAAVRDCDQAISINPDSAQGYKFRGRANRLMGKWVEAHRDLANACKLDYDDTANEWLKEVESNAKKLHDYNRAKERQTEEKELRERRARVKRAQEANKRAAEQSFGGGGGEEGEDAPGGGFGMGGFSELFKELADDPEMLRMLKEDPTLITKLTEIMQNPQNIMKYMGDPGVQKLLGKLGSRFGAAGGGPPPFGADADMGDVGDDAEQENTQPNKSEPSGNQSTTHATKAPEPDLD